MAEASPSLHHSGQPEEKSSQPLIPALVDDLALLCLARVPRAYHKTMRGVSRGWAALIDGGGLGRARKKQGTAETWLFVRTRDSRHCTIWRSFDFTTATWNTLPPVPYSFHSSSSSSSSLSLGPQVRGLGSASVGGKLYVFGGWREGGPALQEVLCYDPQTEQWEQRAPLRTARCYMAYASVGEGAQGRIVVAGGMSRPCLHGSELFASVEIYDPGTDKWAEGPPMLDPILFSTGFSHGSHVYISGDFVQNNERGQRLSLEEEKWALIGNAEFALGLNSPCAVLGDHFFCMRQTLQAWHSQRGCWEDVGAEHKLFNAALPTGMVSSMLFVRRKLVLVLRNSGVIVVEFEPENFSELENEIKPKVNFTSSDISEQRERGFVPWPKDDMGETPLRERGRGDNSLREYSELGRGWPKIRSVEGCSWGIAMADEEVCVCYAMEV